MYSEQNTDIHLNIALASVNTILNGVFTIVFILLKQYLNIIITIYLRSPHKILTFHIDLLQWLGGRIDETDE